MQTALDILRARWLKERDTLTSDLDLAREILQAGDCRLVIVKKGEVLWQSDDRMLLGLLAGVDVLGTASRGASMADVVVGKAAALLARAVGIEAVYTPLLSRRALDYLRQQDIRLEYDLLVEGILNRSRNDLCPLEHITSDIDDAARALEVIRAFYARMSIENPAGEEIRDFGSLSFA